MSEILDLEKQLKKDVANLKKLAEEADLDFFPVNFEVITKKAMIEFGTYALPNRYSHWTFGKDYGRLKNLSNLGVLEILEMVLNSDPATAFLLDSNTLVEHQMVIAHVFAHCDFFKNNYWFSKTNRNMINEAKFHERRIQQLENEYGKKPVEEFIDICLSIQWHVDFYEVFKPDEQKIKVLSAADKSRFMMSSDIAADVEAASCSDQSDENDDSNLSAYDTSGQTKLDDSRTASRGPIISSDEAASAVGDTGPGGSRSAFSENLCDERDLLTFLMREAPLEDWQREILQIVHDEIIYFAPTSLTKIMNEGWATYWHTELCQKYLDFEDFSKFAIKHSELMSSKGLNPYKIGFMIYEDIKYRWDEKDGVGSGLKKIYEVRQFEDDVSFIRNYLTQDICDKCGLFLFEQDPGTGEMVITSTNVEDIKSSIISELINFGKPVIVIRDYDYNQNRELYMQHKFDGRELDMEYAIDVMKALHRIWNRSIHLETIRDDKRMLVTYNGDKPEMRHV